MDYLYSEGRPASSDNEVSTLKSAGKNLNSNREEVNSDTEQFTTSLKSPTIHLAQSATPPKRQLREPNYREKYGYKGPYERKIDLTTLARIQNKQVKLDTEMLDRKFPLPGRKNQPPTRAHSNAPHDPDAKPNLIDCIN